jgi:8-oxo-dGTP diphosphatase
MPDRAPSGSRGGRAPGAELHLVCCTARAGQLLVRAQESVSGGAAIPTTALTADQDPQGRATEFARATLGRAAAGVIHAGTFAVPERAAIALTFAIIMPAGRDAPAGWNWLKVSRTGALTPAAGAAAAQAIERGVRALRERVDLEPIAFRLLADTFTLGELQKLYELLLGRKLHKASFRRSLAAADLVQPVDEWRTEGRGRPAQLFRYAPRRAKGRRGRSVRFELLR